MVNDFQDPNFINSPAYKDSRAVIDRLPPEKAVIFAGRNLRVAGSVTQTNLARFLGKVTFGDYSLDSDPIISSWIISSFLSGFGNLDLKEGVDDSSFWTGNLETRRAQQISLLPKTWDYGLTPEASNAYPLGDYPAAAPLFYAAFDTLLRRWNKTGKTFDAIGDLGAVPVNLAFEWGSLLYIPLGNNGYATYNQGTNTITPSNAVKVVAFQYWDHFLVALTTDGKLRFLDRAGVWEAEVNNSDDVQLPSGRTPRHLVSFRNQQGEPTLHIVTDRDLWAYDRDVPRIYKTDLEFPVHPEQGRAACNWRGDSIYVSVGTGIHGYNGNTITSMGPDYRFGLPAGLRGLITSLTPEYNSLLALIQGEIPVGQSTDGGELHPQNPSYQDLPKAFPNADVRSCIARWNQQGWHMAWVSPGAGGVPTWSIISQADGEYRLWWGYDGKMLTQTLPISFSGPKVGMQVGVDQFEATGELITGWFDADMPAFDKALSHVELALDDVFENGTQTGSIAIQYQVDFDPTWKDLGSANRPGLHIFPFGMSEVEGGMFSYGESMRRMRYRFLFNQPAGQMLMSPILDKMITKFVKIPIQQNSWQFSVNLDAEYGQEGPQETWDFVAAELSSLKFTTLSVGSDTYRVRIAQLSGNRATGIDPRSAMNLNLVEIPIPLPKIRYPIDANGDPIIFEGA